MSKTLCKWGRKAIEDNFKEVTKIVANPRYLCKKCGRSAGSKKYLCKSTTI
ncbi:MAG: hypothetical protein NE328_15805 [Lentisphaeraceae bacterium]|nr:hypothetical protein [Lentisphaeraceae bacterium]